MWTPEQGPLHEAVYAAFDEAFATVGLKRRTLTRITHEWYGWYAGAPSEPCVSVEMSSDSSFVYVVVCRPGSAEKPPSYNDEHGQPLARHLQDVARAVGVDEKELRTATERFSGPANLPDLARVRARFLVRLWPTVVARSAEIFSTAPPKFASTTDPKRLP